MNVCASVRNATALDDVVRTAVDRVPGSPIVRPPDGTGAANPVAAWTGTFTGTGDYAITLTGACFVNTTPTCPADMGVQGGVAGQDGVLDNNDFIVFIDYFFASDPRADVGQQGGLPGADGQFNNNDFIVFIDLFFAGC